MISRTMLACLFVLALATLALQGQQGKKDGVPCLPDSNGMNVYWYWKDRPDQINYNGVFNGNDAVAKAQAAVDAINKCSAASAYSSPYPCPYPYNPFKSCAEVASSATARSAPAPAPRLCHALSIDYKAFARTFAPPGKASSRDRYGVIYLVATCFFEHTGYSVFFQTDSGKFKLMQQDPTGHFHWMFDYFIACWPPNGTVGMTAITPHVTIEDAYGEHQVDVQIWK